MKGLSLHLKFRPLRSSPIYDQVNRDAPLLGYELKYLPGTQFLTTIKYFGI